MGFGVGRPAGSKEAAKRRTLAIRTVGPTLIFPVRPRFHPENNILDLGGVAVMSPVLHGCHTCNTLDL